MRGEKDSKEQIHWFCKSAKNSFSHNWILHTDFLLTYLLPPHCFEWQSPQDTSIETLIKNFLQEPFLLLHKAAQLSHWGKINNGAFCHCITCTVLPAFMGKSSKDIAKELGDALCSSFRAAEEALEHEESYNKNVIKEETGIKSQAPTCGRNHYLLTKSNWGKAAPDCLKNSEYSFFGTQQKCCKSFSQVMAIP